MPADHRRGNDGYHIISSARNAQRPQLDPAVGRASPWAPPIMADDDPFGDLEAMLGGGGSDSESEPEVELSESSDDDEGAPAAAASVQARASRGEPFAPANQPVPP